MRVRPAGSAHPARTGFAGASRPLGGGTATGSKRGKFFRKPGRSAPRAPGSFPVAGANQDFAISLAFFAIKFVNRHGRKIPAARKISRKESKAAAYSTTLLAA